VRLTELRRLVPGGESGQGLAEYALILALVGVAAVVALTFLGGSINSLMSTLGNAL
jgi:pilus assembly protein Flp/PilA